jgi:hypothetical protein
MICSFVRETRVSNSDDIYIKIPTTINISKFPAIRWGLDATRLMGGAPEMKDRTLLWFEWCDREGLTRLAVSAGERER